MINLMLSANTDLGEYKKCWIQNLGIYNSEISHNINVLISIFIDCGKLCGWICAIHVKIPTEFCRVRLIIGDKNDGKEVGVLI
jgi:enhancing lycopene biosynthesis protein 2